jgi:hypothetical protein|tara:strand:+ start:616 stop:861 length:246 start_codon:yes stop_codon:yes gene_type:complete
MFAKLFKRHLTIKTKYNPKIQDDVQAFEKACNILEEQGIEFEKGSEIVATEIGKKIYFRYSLITDIIIWVIIPIISLIIIF